MNQIGNRFNNLEMNEDQAVRCIEIAQSAMNSGDYTKARRFLQKSLGLHQSSHAASLLEKVETLIAEKGETSVKEKDIPTSAPEVKEEPSGHKATFTKEDVDEVSRILSVKMDFYSVLQLEKGCSEDEIKKAYRKVTS